MIEKTCSNLAVYPFVTVFCHNVASHSSLPLNKLLSQWRNSHFLLRLACYRRNKITELNTTVILMILSIRSNGKQSNPIKWNTKFRDGPMSMEDFCASSSSSLHESRESLAILYRDQSDVVNNWFILDILKHWDTWAQNDINFRAHSCDFSGKGQVILDKNNLQTTPEWTNLTSSWWPHMYTQKLAIVFDHIFFFFFFLITVG